MKEGYGSGIIFGIPLLAFPGDKLFVILGLIFIVLGVFGQIANIVYGKGSLKQFLLSLVELPTSLALAILLGLLSFTTWQYTQPILLQGFELGAFVMTLIFGVIPSAIVWVIIVNMANSFVKKQS